MSSDLEHGNLPGISLVGGNRNMTPAKVTSVPPKDRLKLGHVRATTAQKILSLNHMVRALLSDVVAVGGGSSRLGLTSP